MASVDLTELGRFIDRGRVNERAAVRWRIVELSAARGAAATVDDAQTLREVAVILDEMRVLYPEFAPEVDRITARAREDLRRLGVYDPPVGRAEAVRAAAAVGKRDGEDAGDDRVLHDGIRVTTTPEVAGAEITEHRSEVFGLVVTSKAAFPGPGVELNSLGGELRTMTHLLEAIRETAIERMVEQAKTVGADAIVGVRFDSAALADGWVEICAYGTAVKVGPPQAS